MYILGSTVDNKSITCIDYYIHPHFHHTTYSLMQTHRPGHTEYFIHLSLSTGWMVVIMLGTVSSPFVTVGPVPSLVPGWSSPRLMITKLTEHPHFYTISPLPSQCRCMSPMDSKLHNQPTLFIYLFIAHNRTTDGKCK